MASSLISNSHHIDFESVFRLDDAEFFANSSVREDGMVVSTIGGTAIEISQEMFAASFELPTEGLIDLTDVPKNFVFDALSLFSDSKEQVSMSCLKKALKFHYHLLHDILAKTIYVKAGSFDSVTRDRFLLMTTITFDVKINRSSLLFGVFKEMVTPGSRQAKVYAIQICVLLSCMISWLKTIYVKAGSFDSVTRDRFLLMTTITFDVKINRSSLLFGVFKEMVTPGSRQAKVYAIQICVLLRNVPGLELGESKSFPVPRIFNEKTVHRFVSVNENVGIKEVADAPRARRTPVKKTVSKKRQAAGEAEVAPVIKNKRSTKGKPVAARRISLDKQVEDSSSSDLPVAGVASGEHVPVAGVATGEQIPVAEDATEDEEDTVEEADDSQSMDIQGTIEQAGGSTSKVVEEIVAPAARKVLRSTCLSMIFCYKFPVTCCCPQLLLRKSP
ncbi:hypothetical protein F511_11284 [Dorcoceras hygrometricum]|uniref:Uncharacterized protein n=1 Tax=Dorcoceras hygrometricum TaxID=472368 RepID=A0A2Z7B7X3_9LAMI|nr:hypothetical protein F511_11284 [Dorcoceras hygrometricum]